MNRSPIDVVEEEHPRGGKERAHFHLREPSNANETISVGGYAKERVTNLTSNEMFVAATEAKESQPALRWRRSLPKNGYVRIV